jgi:hypothetical protein
VKFIYKGNDETFAVLQFNVKYKLQLMKKTENITALNLVNQLVPCQHLGETSSAQLDGTTHNFTTKVVIE